MRLRKKSVIWKFFLHIHACLVRLFVRPKWFQLRLIRCFCKNCMMLSKISRNLWTWYMTGNMLKKGSWSFLGGTMPSVWLCHSWSSGFSGTSPSILSPANEIWLTKPEILSTAVLELRCWWNPVGRKIFRNVLVSNRESSLLTQFKTSIS